MGEEGREKEGEKGEEGKGIKGKGGKEDFRALLQFQICQYTTDAVERYIITTDAGFRKHRRYGNGYYTTAHRHHR